MVLNLWGSDKSPNSPDRMPKRRVQSSVPVAHTVGTHVHTPSASPLSQTSSPPPRSAPRSMEAQVHTARTLRLPPGVWRQGDDGQPCCWLWAGRQGCHGRRQEGERRERERGGWSRVWRAPTCVRREVNVRCLILYTVTSLPALSSHTHSPIHSQTTIVALSSFCEGLQWTLK